MLYANAVELHDDMYLNVIFLTD